MFSAIVSNWVWVQIWDKCTGFMIRSKHNINLFAEAAEEIVLSLGGELDGEDSLTVALDEKGL